MDSTVTVQIHSNPSDCFCIHSDSHNGFQWCHYLTDDSIIYIWVRKITFCFLNIAPPNKTKLYEKKFNINSKIRYNSKRFNKSKLNIKQLRKMVIGHIVDFVKFVQKWNAAIHYSVFTKILAHILDTLQEKCKIIEKLLKLCNFNQNMLSILSV